MKTRLFKTILALTLALIALPMMGQDFMNVYFKDGTFRKFYLKNVTEITTSKLDADGIQHSEYDYQHVTTIYDKYIYNLEDVDSITFTKYNEEVADRNLELALKSILPMVNNCKTRIELENKLDEINETEGVEKAWSDGHVLHVKISGGENVTIHRNYQKNNDYDNTIITNFIKKIPRWAQILSDKEIRFAIVNQTHYDEDREWRIEEIVYPIRDMLRSYGITTEYIRKPTLDFFYDNSNDLNNLHLYDYDFVLLLTHGSYDNLYENGLIKIHEFATAEELGKSAPDDLGYIESIKIGNKIRTLREKYNATDYDITLFVSDEVRDGVDNSVYYAAITESFLSNNAKGKFINPNAVLFNSACESLKGNFNIARIFRDKRNLGTYFGYDESDSKGELAAFHLLSNMLNCKSLEVAYGLIPDSLRNEVNEDGVIARLWRDPETDSKTDGLFIVKTYTEEISQAKVDEEFAKGNGIEIRGFASIHNTKNGPEGGFQYGENKDDLSEMVPVTSASIIDNVGKGNLSFTSILTNLKADKTYYYRAFTKDDKYFNYGEIYSFTTPKEPVDIPAEPINLGLPSGTLWASCNVGATEPEDFGGYYAWGEKEEKSNYDWDSYIFSISSEYFYNMTKYCTDSRYGTLDNKTTLDPEDDVAHVEWGGNWRMPTTEEIDELMANCSQEWTISKGVWGCKFTGSNGNFIFLPAAGLKKYEQLEYNGTSGSYWSSSLNTNNPNTSYDLRISGDGAVKYFQNRYIGQCVRPVMSNSTPPANLSLSSYTMELTSGETKTVTITSGSGNYTVESNDPNVAQADEKDGLVTIIGRRPSTIPAIITVTDNVTTKTATITVTVMSATDYSTGEAIDLGLPSGTLWASCNIGASSEVEPGSFFAWGETEAKQTFYRSNYQYYNSSTDTYKSLGYNISGTQYDAAHIIWGGTWRMPTMADFKELRDNCQTKWTTYKGVICKQYTGPNGKSIYLPAAGYYSGDVLKEKDETGNYWSADLYPEDEKSAYLIVTENSSQNTTYYGGRSLGATIRPVQKTSIPEEDRITQVVPEEYLDVLDDHINIYKGNNPPNIEGEYLVEPCTMLYDSDGDFNVGHEFAPLQIKICNQDILNNTVDYEEKQANSESNGIGSFISGEGDNFSVFFNTEGVSHFSEYDVHTKTAMIVSGTKTADGISNLTYSFIITSKSDDPQNKIMNVGDYRVIHDGDGLAENYPWNTPESSKKRRVNESETLLPHNTNDSYATRNRATEKNNAVRVIRKE